MPRLPTNHIFPTKFSKTLLHRSKSFKHCSLMFTWIPWYYTSYHHRRSRGVFGGCWDGSNQPCLEVFQVVSNCRNMTSINSFPVPLSTWMATFGRLLSRAFHETVKLRPLLPPLCCTNVRILLKFTIPSFSAISTSRRRRSAKHRLFILLVPPPTPPRLLQRSSCDDLVGEPIIIHRDKQTLMKSLVLKLQTVWHYGYEMASEESSIVNLTVLPS